MDPRRRLTGLLGALVLLGSAACNTDDPNTLGGTTATGAGGSCEDGPSGSTGSGGEGQGGASTGPGTGSGGGTVEETILDQRVVDYHEALRTASLKLVGALPTMAQIKTISDASDQAAAYGTIIDELMNDVRFRRRMVDFWKNEFRTGGTAPKDTAATFAARITVEGLPYTDLFTAQTNTCPTFNGTDFLDGSCSNANPTAGVLTNPGLLAQFDGNMAFRRVRFYQEAFACRKQPAEFSDTPIPMGAGDYTAPWEFDSIAGAANGGRIDFLDTSSAICANCHATANHRAPLWAVFDAAGTQQASIQVRTPVEGVPLSVMTDWLPEGQQQTAYKLGQSAATLLEMGAHMADDPEIHACAVTRIWNLAMSKGDVVNDAAAVPTVVIEDLVDDFVTNDFNLRAVVRAVFTHPDFVRF